MNKRSIVAIGAGIALASSAGVMAVSGLGVVSLVPAATMQGEQADPAPTGRRCTECGRIESANDLPSGADNRAIRIREYTVRMADGSSRTFTSAPDVRWRVGENLSWIGGGSRTAR
jgi:hypothetical protein